MLGPESPSALGRAARSFIAVYQARPELIAEQSGWRCMITLVGSDTGEALSLRVEDGHVRELRAGADGGDVVITADERTLCAVLELRLGPNEPYVFGELTVRGPEEDFFRLDYITSRLCPE